MPDPAAPNPPKQAVPPPRRVIRAGQKEAAAPVDPSRRAVHGLKAEPPPDDGA